MSLVSYREVKQIKDRHLQELLSLPGVIGVGIGMDLGGGLCLTLHVKSKGEATRIPRSVEGVRVRVEEIGDAELR